MNESKLTAELARNCKASAGKLAELFKAYELAKIGDDMQEEQIRDIENNILQTVGFFAGEDGGRVGIEKGGRVLDEKFTFLLSEEDFQRLQNLITAETARQGITDENGTYLVPWTTLKVEARRSLVDFIIDNIIPEGMRSDFQAARFNYTMNEKLLEISRSLVAA